MADWYVFWVIAPISVISGVAMVLARNAVHAALLLIVNFFTLAVFFLILGSPFLFVVQIIVYAGAIMVLFLFVIMLLGVDRTESLVERVTAQPWLAGALGAGLVAEVVTAVWLGLGVARERLPDFDQVNQGGNIRALARVLFGPYFLPFEVTSVLLIVAAIGAMLHGRRRIDQEPTIDRPEDYRPSEPTYGEPAGVAGGQP
ncbi:MAG: NADH-quinone oxidoreductase subunit J [Actinomycetota bacterium]